MGTKNKLPDVFNVEQIIRLFDGMDRPKVAIATALSFFCGLRISEACKLKIGDIDLERKRLKVVDSKFSMRTKTKYGKDRYVPIPDQMISPLKKWIEIINGGKWFLPSHKSPDSHIRTKSLGEQFREVLQRIGLLIPMYELNFKQKIHGKIKEKHVTRYKYHFHTLRHAYATYLRDKGVDIYTISDLLGHNQVTTTQIYARISDTQRVQAVNEAFNISLRSRVVNIPSLPTGTGDIEKLKLEVKSKELELEMMKEKNRQKIIQTNPPIQIETS